MDKPGEGPQPGETGTDLLCRAARAAEQRPAFLASAFAAYRAAERLDEQGLARILGIPLEQVCALALCLRPRPSSFSDDVRRMAERFHVEPHTLAGIIRQVEAIEAIQAAAAGTGQVAAAAREAEEPPDEDTTP